MKNTKFTGLLTKKKTVRYLIYLLLVCVFAVFVIKLNQVEKTELVVRTGQTFEKAKVVKVLEDNLQENGTCVSTLLLDYSYDLPYQQIINSNNIGIAIMQGLAGSFGIVLSVPFTVLICTVLFHKSK